MPSNRRAFPKPREFPRDIMLKLPSPEECCTAEETIFWNQTMQMAKDGATPIRIAEFAATGLDDPMLARAYPTIREAMRRWAAMGDVWQDYDSVGKQAEPPRQDWNEPKELWPTG
jgi:hypothetical protein